MKDKIPEFKTSAQHWKYTLFPKISQEWNQLIEEFEKDILLKKQGKISDQLFAETRLRKGAYGQRYDNGKRYDGQESQEIPYPQPNLAKGPGTFWNAPGMLRIKIPFGGVSAKQMIVIADLAEEYADSIIHITTRQDIQYHFTNIEEMPSIFRRLAAVDITTQEACGNSIRNVTACPKSGVCKDQSFDVTPYANAVFRYLLAHPDVQNFGRKFKISLSGCKDHPCGLSNIHDLGMIAKIKQENGKTIRGFEFYVGGGLGAVPYNAKLFGEFIPEQEILPTIQAICRVYARLGEKKKRHMSRIKYLISKMGIEDFIDTVLKEKASLPTDPKWTTFLNNLNQFNETAEVSITHVLNYGIEPKQDLNFDEWVSTNVEQQRQDNFVMVTINLPLGDSTPNQFRTLADCSLKYAKNSARTTVEQNVLLRWVPKNQVHNLYQDLKKVHLHTAGAGTIIDITSCPGTDTCKLGISSSRGLASVLRQYLAEKSMRLDQAIKNLRIKVSGCFNSCGQQYLADIGFYGISRIVNGFAVPHYQLLLGGEWKHNGRSYGLAVGSFPSKAIPIVVDALCDLYLKTRESNEIFKSFINRVGKKNILAKLKSLSIVPLYEDNSNYYTDWGDIREFSIKDKGIGECAGEVVSLTDFGLKQADRELFEAQILIEEEEYQKAGELCFTAMKHSAQALIKEYNPDISDFPEQIMTEFKPLFYNTKLIYDEFGGDRFVQYYLNAHDNQNEIFDQEKTQIRIEETRLFIEACHSCNIKMEKQKLVQTVGKK